MIEFYDLSIFQAVNKYIFNIEDAEKVIDILKFQLAPSTKCVEPHDVFIKCSLDKSDGANFSRHFSTFFIILSYLFIFFSEKSYQKSQ